MIFLLKSKNINLFSFGLLSVTYKRGNDNTVFEKFMDRYATM